MKKAWYIPLLLLILVSCGDDDSNPGTPSFDRTLILDNVAQNMVLPTYQEMVTETTALESSAQTFVTNLDQASLESLQQQWLTTKLSWKTGEIFNFGPIENLALETSVDNWPTNDFGIESTLQTSQPIDQDFLTTIGSDRKGLPAIEYLLFATDTPQTIEDFSNSTNRQDYLLALTTNLKQIATTVLNEWSSDGNNYAQTFTESTGNTASSATTLLANEMIFLLEVLKNFKIALPLGLRTGGAVDPELVESPYALQSLVLAQENLEAIDLIFTGGNGNGFDDYLDALNIQGENQLLSQEINQQIAQSRSALSAINAPLKEAITNDPQAVETAFLELQELTVLMKTDMMSMLGLLVIFSDNDGD